MSFYTIFDFLKRDKLKIQEKVERFLKNYYKELKSIIVLFMVVLYFFTAKNSNGFYYADEHFQIVEFANLKLGNNEVSDMAWEYEAKIRPAVQPVLCYFFIKGFSLFSINSPYDIAFGLRLITGAFSMFMLLFFIRRTEGLFLDLRYKIYYYFIGASLCYLAFMNVRFSSETWSGLLLVSCFLLMLDVEKGKGNFYSVGAVFGLAFLFRFQVAFSFFGIILWFLFMKKSRWVDLFKMLLTFFLIVMLGVVIDSLFYGAFVFTSLNYFYLGTDVDKASLFGVEPWYFYITNILTEPNMFIGLPTLVALVVFVVKKSKHFLTWMVVPFIFFHSLVPHKEIRFLFPLLNFIPFVLVTVLYESKIQFEKRWFVNLVIGLVVFVNLVFLILLASKPNGPGRLHHTKYIYDNYKKSQVRLLYQDKDYPFVKKDWELTMNFYKQKNLKTMMLEDISSLDSVVESSNSTTFLLINKKSLDEDTDVGDSEDWELVNESMPLKIKWVRFFENYGIKVPKSDLLLLLFRYKKKE